MRSSLGEPGFHGCTAEVLPQGPMCALSLLYQPQGCVEGQTAYGEERVRSEIFQGGPVTRVKPMCIRNVTCELCPSVSTPSGQLGPAQCPSVVIFDASRMACGLASSSPSQGPRPTCLPSPVTRPPCQGLCVCGGGGR